MSSYSWIIPAVLVLGCRAQQASAERVKIETEVVEEVCRGTLVHAESELARMEAELELEAMRESVEIHVVDPERIEEWCPNGDEPCVQQPPRRIYVSTESYAGLLTRELVRARLVNSPARASKPMFFEGLATALTQPICRPLSAWDPPTPGKLLGKHSGTSLNKEELYLAGELLRWLLDTRGPDQVLDFMAKLERSATPDQVRLSYLEHFGTSIDVDLYEHWRPADEPLAPERAGCVGPELPRDHARSRLLVDASFDCDSPLVRNDFTQPGRAFVEWTLTVDASNAGHHGIIGALPEGYALTLSLCECRDDGLWTQAPPNDSVLWNNGGVDPSHGASLAPGVYRLRAYGPIGGSLQQEIGTPCIYAEQNCPAGQQCTLSGFCQDEVENPGRDGDPCWPTFFADGEQLPCASGFTCIGPPEGSGVCMPICGEPSGLSCSDGRSCGPLRACTQVCDPFAPDCGAGWQCIPDFKTGKGGCYPLPNGDLGLLDSCSVAELQCAPGYWCKNFDDIDGCHDADAFLDLSGCCTPICDPAAADPGCPPELPNCLAGGHELLGRCGLE